MLFEKYDPDQDMLVRGPAEPEDLSPRLARLLNVRWRALWKALKATRCMAADCCADAKALAQQKDHGSVMVLTTGLTPDVNDDSGLGVSWDTNVRVGVDFSHSTGAHSSRGIVEKGGLYRLYAILTYSSAVAQTSLGLQFRVDGVATVSGTGRGGYISGGASPHLASSTSLEAWVSLSAGQYVEVIPSRNGAAGTVNLIAGESLFVMERRPEDEPEEIV